MLIDSIPAFQSRGGLKTTQASALVHQQGIFAMLRYASRPAWQPPKQETAAGSWGSDVLLHKTCGESKPGDPRYPHISDEWMFIPQSIW